MRRAAGSIDRTNFRARAFKRSGDQSQLAVVWHRPDVCSLAGSGCSASELTTYVGTSGHEMERQTRDFLKVRFLRVARLPIIAMSPLLRSLF
jgi:hypothetical protein